MSTTSPCSATSSPRCLGPWAEKPVGSPAARAATTSGPRRRLGPRRRCSWFPSTTATRSAHGGTAEHRSWRAATGRTSARERAPLPRSS
eukprot:6063737-Alexandrium_andersonii.AAC.1